MKNEHSNMSTRMIMPRRSRVGGRRHDGNDAKGLANWVKGKVLAAWWLAWANQQRGVMAVQVALKHWAGV